MNKHTSAADTAVTSTQRNGGEILVAALRVNGITRMFGVPGESALPVFDATYGDDAPVRFVQCRHESTASHMAEADGKLSGLPGVCVVSRGPGATHAMIGVHTAWQDSTPMILLVGQVPREHAGREAFQEMDYVKLFADTTKWAAQINSADLIPEFVNRAVAIAMQGRPGPVVLAIPEDVLSELSSAPDARPVQVATAAPSDAQLKKTLELLQAAKRPLIIAGNIGVTDEASLQLQAFAERNDVPVIAGFRSQDVMNNTSEKYVGDISLGGSRVLFARVKSADFILVIGDRLGDITTQHYTLVDAPTPAQTIVHVFPGAEDLGRVYTPALAIQSNSSEFIAALAKAAPLQSAGWADWRRDLRAEYVTYQDKPAPVSGLDMSQVVKHLNEVLADDAVVTNGAGNYSIWVHRFYRYRGRGTQLAPKSGAMSYGLPAAIAAKLRFPERQVVCFAGDGCFMMASPEFSTAVQQNLPIVVIVVNNAMYGSIRMHQELNFPGRPSGTELLNPNFAALAQAYGVHGEVVEHHDAFPAAYARAVATNGPAIIELRTEPNQITPDRCL